MPTSKKQAAANRANAARSTGPRTEEGKQRSAQNARKHGFTAHKFAVVRLDELDDLANLRADAIATYQPANSQELYAVERIALAQAALLRCAQMEVGFHTMALNETINIAGMPHTLLTDQLTKSVPVTQQQNLALCLTVGFERSQHRSDAWKLFLRYQAQTERLYRRAVEDLDRLRAIREQLPNEPIAEPESPQPIPPEDLLPQKDPAEIPPAGHTIFFLYLRSSAFICGQFALAFPTAHKLPLLTHHSDSDITKTE